MKVSTRELKSGMQFSKPVYVDGNNLLVPPGIPLKQKDIDRLIRWEIQYIETEGSILTKDEIQEMERQNIRDRTTEPPGFEAYVPAPSLASLV